MHKCPNCSEIIEISSAQGMFKCPKCFKALYLDTKQIIQVYRNDKFYDNCSKLKIGTSGLFKGHKFNVIGSIQLTGLTQSWTEWCIQFDDNIYGWLTELSGHYFIKIDNSGMNTSLISELFGDESVNYVNELFEIKPPLFKTEIQLNNLFFSFTGKLVGYPTDFKGTLPFSPTEEHIEFVISSSTESELLFFTSSLTKTYMVGKVVTDYDLNLYNFRLLSDYFTQTGGKKYRLTSVPCPACSSANPKITGVSESNFCISCGSKFTVNSKTPILTEDIKPIRARDNIFYCGNLGSIGNVPYIITGYIAWKSDDGIEMNDYFIYTKNNKNSIYLLRQKENLWLFLDYNLIEFMSNITSLKKSSFLGKYTPYAISGTFPFTIDYNSILTLYQHEDMVYTDLLLNASNSQFIFSSTISELKLLRFGVNFKFDFI